VRFQFFNFYFWNVGLELTNGEMGNPWEQMLLIGAKKQMSDPKKQHNHLAMVP
jgi:hypothetical protein